MSETVTAVATPVVLLVNYSFSAKEKVFVCAELYTLRGETNKRIFEDRQVFKSACRGPDFCSLTQEYLLTPIRNLTLLVGGVTYRVDTAALQPLVRAMANFLWYMPSGSQKAIGAAFEFDVRDYVCVAS